MFSRLFNSPWFFFGLAALLIGVAVVSQFQRADVEAPLGDIEEVLSLKDRKPYNVVFILIDTLRADRLSAYGYNRETSPNIDALAERGVRFARVESQSSWTKASMASLWTGLYPQRTGVIRFPHALPEDAVMPAEVFQEAGYRTGGVWRNGWVANNFGFSQGFDLYIRPIQSKSRDDIRRFAPSSFALSGTDLDVTVSASEFVMGTSGNPFLLYLHYMDVHQYVYSDVSPDYGTDISDIYDSSIHWTDQNVGLVVEMLRARGLLDDTWIIIASDHGEAFFEHGGEGHARNLYTEVQQVPLIIAPPVSLSPGLVVEERVANVDIWPTILDLLGLPPLPDAQGESLVPLIEAAAGLRAVPEELVERPLFAQLDRSWGRATSDPDPMVSVMKNDFKMLHRFSEPDRDELYDRSIDPLEQENLAGSQEDIRAELAEEIDEFSKQSVVWDESFEVEIDEMNAAQLRALGYVLPAAQKDVEGAKPVPRPPAPRKVWGED